MGKNRVYLYLYFWRLEQGQERCSEGTVWPSCTRDSSSRADRSNGCSASDSESSHLSRPLSASGRKSRERPERSEKASAWAIKSIPKKSSLRHIFQLTYMSLANKFCEYNNSVISSCHIIITPQIGFLMETYLILFGLGFNSFAFWSPRLGVTFMPLG